MLSKARRGPWDPCFNGYEQNKALLTKLGWRLVHDQTSLWARVLRSKYKVGDLRDQSWICLKQNNSSMWKSVGTCLREVVLHDLKWVLGNGRDIRFWTDRWLSDQSLEDRGITPLLVGYEEIHVADLWRDRVGWQLDHISPYIPYNLRLELAAVVVDNITGVKDRMAWRGSAGKNRTWRISSTRYGRWWLRRGLELSSG